jgi:hypothetical protein
LNIYGFMNKIFDTSFRRYELKNQMKNSYHFESILITIINIETMIKIPASAEKCEKFNKFIDALNITPVL